VLEEQEAAVIDPGQPGPETAGEASLLVLAADLVLDLLPLHPNGGLASR